MKYSNKIILLSAVFLLMLAVASTIRHSAAQTGPLTYPEIITALNSKLPNTSFKNKTQLLNFLIDQVRKRKVDKPLNDTREDDLRQVGATDELIKAIRQNSPSLSTPTPTKTPIPNVTPVTRYQKLRNSIGMTFTYITAGSFQMGDSHFGPIHNVTLSRGFYMGQTEVTQAQWLAIMGTSPSYFKGADLPVDSVSWDDVQDFIRKLNSRGEGTYRLPTEAEWEYAGRAGTMTKYYSGDTDISLDRYAWYYANSGRKTHDVATRQPNAWDLYDMEGNVFEWCEDWFENYESRSVTDPKGAGAGSFRIVRGGGYDRPAEFLRTAIRSYFPPSFRSSGLGFRLIREP